MVVISRCLSSLVLLVAGAECARISRKKKSEDGLDVPRDCYAPYDGKPSLVLTKCNAEQREVIESQLEEAGCTMMGEFLPRDCSDTEVVCSGEEAASLEKRGVAKILSPDAGASWRSSSGVTQSFAEGLSAASDFYTAWRGLDAQNAHVEALVQASGGVATLETVGRSLEGRDIKIVRFRGAGYSSGGTRVVASFNMHAREWITGMSGVYTVDKMIQKVQQDPNFLAGTEVVLMPMVNPDGFLYSTTNDRMHRKNMEKGSNSCPGVDLNRNWDANWASGGSSGSQCSEQYHGTAAMSEPETVVLAQVMNESPMTAFIDVHSYSELLLSAYGYTSATHPRNAEYRSIGRAIQTAIRNSGGNNWTEGAWAPTLYTASGNSVDYADARGALGICFELRPGRWGGGGFAPPASQIVPGAEESFEGLVAAIDWSKNPPAPTPAPPGECPWHGCVFGCSMSSDCQYCERCQ